MKNITLSCLIGISLSVFPGHINAQGKQNFVAQLNLTTQANITSDSYHYSQVNLGQSLTSQVPRALPRKITKPIKSKLVDKTDSIQKSTNQTINSTADSANAVLTDKALDTTELTAIVSPAGKLLLTEKRLSDNQLAVAYEWVGILTELQIIQLKKLAFTNITQQKFSDLGLSLISFRVIPTLDSFKKLSEVLPIDIMQQLDRNHIFSTQSQLSSAINPDNLMLDTTKSSLNNLSCQSPVIIGMVDTAIQAEHQFLASSQLIQKSFLGTGFNQPTNHGTAVAGRFISNHPQALGATPNATLYAASVFYQRQDASQGATLLRLVEGLNWLASQGVSVINLSLTGPKNKVLAAVVERLNQKGIALIAAAGNQGPAAPPLYPAAYPHVIAVTAVAQNKRIYRWANQGEHIDFAANGVNVNTTRSDNVMGQESGTSLAAPIIAAAMACQMYPKQSSNKAFTRLIERALDLGEKGHDSVFGHGFIGSTL